MIYQRLCHRIITFLVLLMMLISITVTVSPVSAAGSITVVNTNDSGEGSLRQAIEEIDAGGMITFASGLSGETITLDSTLVIDKNMTIDAGDLDKPVTISGNESVRVFFVEHDVTATLIFLMIRDGKPTESNGGGIFNNGTLTLEYCTVFYNEAAFNGGGINNYGHLTLYRSSIGSNKSNFHGGAFYNDSGSTLNIVESAVFENTAGRNGGAIFNMGTLTVTTSTFSSNFAESIDAITGYGGAIYNFKGSVTIESSTISENIAGGDEGYGGGILNSGTATITNSTLSGNIAEGIDSYGGGIMNYAILSITNSTLYGNSVGSDFGGGGIYQSGTGTLTYVNTIIAGSIGGDCVNSFLDDGIIHPDSTHNLVQDPESDCNVTTNLSGDPLLAPLADNGGPTMTHALLPGSPAIDAGSMAYCLEKDQRGVDRPQDGNGDGTAVCDIGAFELELPLLKIYLPLILR